MDRPTSASCASTYDRLAPVYDALTADYGHAVWLERLHALAALHGAPGRRLLDLGCGSGSSFLPLLGDGYEVTGCEVSPAMADRARARAQGRARVIAGDMAELPDVGPFDVVTCLDDAVNHILDRRRLTAAFRAVARVLRPGGVLVFDTNTLATYRTGFAGDHAFERAGHAFRWRGLAARDAGPGAVAAVELSARCPDGAPVRALHVQRHHPVEVVRDLLEGAGLRVQAIVGQTPGCVLHREHDELVHSKTVFVATRPRM